MVLVAFALLATWSHARKAALACASCGSGGDDPLVLFPAETVKFLTGVSVTPSLASTGPDGKRLASTGPDRRVSTIAAAGVALSARGFVTVSGSFTTNSRGDASKSGLADPSIAGRYTVVMPRLDRPLIPQVQLLAGYRPAMTRSIHDSSDPMLLDVFGSGFDEWRTGVDVWMGMPAIKPGFALTVTEPLAARHNGVMLKPGRLVRGTLSLTSMISTMQIGDYAIAPRQVKLAAGLITDRRGPLWQDGQPVRDSEQSVDGFFASTDFAASESGTVKLVMARQGITRQTRNAVESTTWSVGWSLVLR